jgi:hypothetical protein
LIDKEGNIVYTHFGEGKYQETENEIVRLLNLEVKKEEKAEEQKVDFSKIKTRETYLGTERRKNFAGLNAEKISKNQ